MADLPDSLQQLAARLAGRSGQALSLPGFREAAVLVPVVTAPEGARLLFTVRTADLPTHPGQISFPGGKRDPDDTSLEATALREAKEELGLAQGVRLLGRLDDVPTPAGFVITPVVGLLSEPLDLRPNDREVAEVFSVPLQELRRVYRSGGERSWMGVRYTMHEFPYERWRIWGATATMVQQLLGLLEG